MDAGPEIEAHHHGHTGHRWLDIGLGVAAMLVSVISLVLAVHHGQTMEKMVEASTWPYVDFARSSGDPEGHPRADLILTNAGVGPARLETVEVFYKGVPQASLPSLVKATTGGQGLSVIKSTAADRVLPAGEKTVFVSAMPDGAPGFSLFRAGLSDVAARVCYCSVLDACWLRDSRQSKPEKVKVCPKPVVAYED